MQPAQQPFQAAWMNRSTGEVCGLYFTVPGSWQTTRNYLPQVKLESHTTITPVCYTTTLSQTFNNPSENTISQACYTFPLYDGVAVSSYTIIYGEKTLRGIVQQKEKAKKTYDAAVERGETAGLLESLPAGVFGVTLGNLPAKTDVHVDIVYCGELKHDATIDGLRYMLPTSIAPRYGEYPGQLLKSTATNKGGISITVDVDMNKNAIRKVQSPSHPIAVSLGATSAQDSHVAFNQSQASTTLTLGTAELEGDFVLQLQIDDISKPQAILEQHPKLASRAIMTTFVPKFALESSHPEIVFIADQSGSMRGDKNTALVSALKVFLKSLPVGVYFNIIAFGSKFEALWPKSQAYNESNMTAAIEFVDTFEAQYDGTEMLQPVEAAFERRLGDMPLEVMLLTDGEIWQEEALFSLINRQVGKNDMGTRVFTLGVGSQVSHTLVEGVARAGNGFAQFVTQGEEIDRKVVRMLKGALYPHLKDQTMEINYSEDADQTDTASDDDFELVEKVDYGINIENLSSAKPAEETTADVMENDKDKVISLYDTSADLDSPIKAGNIENLPTITTPNIIQAPNQLPSLFPFNRTTVYLLLGPDAPQKKISSITFRATSPQGPLELIIDVDDTNTGGTTIHQLAARKAIQDLEEGRGWLQTASIHGVPLKDSHKARFEEFVEREAVRIGELYQVAGKWTSFVAVDDKNGKVDDTTEDITADDTRARNPPQHPPQPLRRAHRNTGGVSRGHGGLNPYGSSPRQQRAYSAVPDRSMVVPSSFRASSNTRVGGDGALFSARSTASSSTPRRKSYKLHLAMSAPLQKCKRVDTPSGVMPTARVLHHDATESKEEAEDYEDAMGFALYDDDGQSASAAAISTRRATHNEEEAEDDDDDAMDSVSFVTDDHQPAPAAAAAATAASMPTPLSPASERSVLHALIGLQTFVGAWDWNDELFKILGKDVAFDPTAFALKQIMATALAVAFLESRLAGSRDVWEMVVVKAKKWMVSMGARDTEGAVEAAKARL
jgi:hypothetical protein